MKKVIIILTVLLASIGCTKKECTICTTVIISDGITEMYQCDCNNEIEEKTLTVYNATGQLIYFQMTRCE